MQKNFITPGMSDDAFERDKVPMTKEEVREISLCKLHLKENSILLDIGSGTGSIAVEAALLSTQIQVYAFESNPLAVELIGKNAKRYDCQNLQIVEGMAPESFDKLEGDFSGNQKPTHAFIGGSKGQLKEILTRLYQWNSSMRIVINAVSLESVTEIQNMLEAFSVTDISMTQVSISRIQPVGNYHMFQANNPVFVCAFQFQE